MPCGGIVIAKGFKYRYNRLGEQDIGWSTVGMICSAGAIGVFKIKISTEPFTWRIGISKRIGIIIKKRFVPGQSVITESEETNHYIDDQQDKNWVLAKFLQGGKLFL